MPQTPVTTLGEKAPTIDALRLHLTESDRKRREILAQLFFQFADDVSPVVKILFAEASPSTLQKVEALLSVEPSTEGGAS